MGLSKQLSKRATFKPPALAALNPLESAAKRVLTRWPEVVPQVREQDHETIIRGLARSEAKDDWEGVKLAIVVLGARIVFSPKFRDKREYARLRDFYLEEALASKSPGFLGGMLSAYIATYDPDSAHTRLLAKALSASRSRLRENRQRLLRNFPELLRPAVAFSSIAELMRSMKAPWDELKALGIQSPHAPGLMDHVHLAFLKLIASRLHRDAEIQRLIGWLRPDGGEARSSGSVEAIEALLTPWKKRSPDVDLKRFLVDSLGSLYGDPRVKRGPPWGSVDEVSMQVVMRWLTGRSIEFFLDVVSSVEESHMWEPRRRFWLGLHEKGRIDEAWVAFSDPAVRKARQLRAQANNPEGIAFGRQNGPRPSTSLLILRIGKCLLVEGSHSYKIHFFRASSQRGPKLFRQTYNCEVIRKLPNETAIAHHSGWQGRVMEMIEYLS
jgi:hypothetical protein